MASEGENKAFNFFLLIFSAISLWFRNTTILLFRTKLIWCTITVHSNYQSFILALKYSIEVRILICLHFMDSLKILSYKTADEITVSSCRWLSFFPSCHVLKYYFPVGWLFSLLLSSQKLQFFILHHDHLNWGHWSFHSWRTALILYTVRGSYKCLADNGDSKKNANIFISGF